MKRSLLVVILCFTFLQSAIGQPSDPPSVKKPVEQVIDLTPKWKVGDTLSLDLVRKVSATNPLTKQPLPEMTQSVTLSVLQANKDGFVVEWKYGDITIGGEKAPPEAVSDPGVALLQSLSIEIELSPSCELLGVRNVDAVLTKLDKAREAAEEQSRAAREAGKALGKPNLETAETERRMQEAVENLKKFMAEMRKNTAHMQNMLLGEAGHYFVGQGWQFEPGKERVLPREAPNPFGGSPFMYTWKLAMRNYDRASETDTVTWTQEFDPEALKQTVRETIERVQKGAGIQHDVGEINVEQEEHAEFVIDRKSGWCVEGWYRQRRVTNGKESRYEMKWKKSAK